MSTGHGRPDPAKSRIANSMGKARILMESLPYIRQFRGATVVIKYGGSAMVDADLQDSFAGDITLLSMVGMHPVVVHGGGPQISAAMEREGIEPEWVDGLRVTGESTIRVVQRVLAGEVNADIVRMLVGHGAPAVGITGLDLGLLRCAPRDPALGLVGEITAVNTDLIEGMIHNDRVTVVAPLALGADGRVYNVNADTAAAAIARALGAQKLVFLTDVEGVYRDEDDPESLISRLDLAELRHIVDSMTGGMRPKLEAVIEAMEGGVKQAHILDGRVQHAVLLEIFTQEGIGTMVTHGAAV